MRFIKYLYLLLFCILFASCEQEEKAFDAQSVSFYLSPSTRSNEIAEFADGDAVGVYVLDKSVSETLQPAGNHVDNKKYIWDSSKRAFVAENLSEMVFNYPDRALVFIVYYPYDNIADATNLSHAITGSSKTDDFLYAVNSEMTGTKDIELSFKHLLSKVNVKYTSAENRALTQMSVATYTDTRINLANGVVTTVADMRSDIALERVEGENYAGFIGVIPPQTWLQGEQFGTLTYTGIGSYPFSFAQARTFVSGSENEVYFMSRQPAYVFSATPATLSVPAKPSVTYPFTITSTKSQAINGTNLPGTTIVQNYSVVSKPDWLTISGTTITVSENRTTESRSGSIVFQQEESSYTTSVVVTQAAGVTTYEYAFTFSDGTTSKSWSGVAATGGTNTYSITSTRKILINGTEVATESVAYSGSANVLWATVTGTTITVPENRTSARSGVITFTQASSGKTITVNVSQAAGVTTYEYTFTFSDGTTSKSWSGVAATGGTNTYTITSTRKVLINGVEEQTESVAYSGSANVSWVSFSGSSIIVDDNPAVTPRGGIATFTQTGSGKTITVTILQQKKNAVDID